MTTFKDLRGRTVRGSNGGSVRSGSLCTSVGTPDEKRPSHRGPRSRPGGSRPLTREGEVSHIGVREVWKLDDRDVRKPTDGGLTPIVASGQSGVRGPRLPPTSIGATVGGVGSVLDALVLGPGRPGRRGRPGPRDAAATGVVPSFLSVRRP